jgi:hypothetical protein
VIGDFPRYSLGFPTYLWPQSNEYLGESSWSTGPDEIIWHPQAPAGGVHRTRRESSQSSDRNGWP